MTWQLYQSYNLLQTPRKSFLESREAMTEMLSQTLCEVALVDLERQPYPTTPKSIQCGHTNKFLSSETKGAE